MSSEKPPTSPRSPPDLPHPISHFSNIPQAYAPLVRAKKNDDPTLVEIAKAHDVSTTQVLIRWSVQHGFVPLPKSDNPTRIKNNADVFGFELTDDEVKKIDAKALPGGEGAICPYLADVE